MICSAISQTTQSQQRLTPGKQLNLKTSTDEQEQVKKIELQN